MVGVYELTKVAFLHPHILIIQSSTLSHANYELATTHFIYKKKKKKPFFFFQVSFFGGGADRDWEVETKIHFLKIPEKEIQHRFLRFAFSIQQLGLSYYDVLIGKLMT